MEYSDEFVAAVKRAFPYGHALHRALDDGSPDVGRYLDDACRTGIANEAILGATSLDSLKATAAAQAAQNALYDDWKRLIDADQTRQSPESQE